MKATWDQRYDRDDYLFGTEPAEFLKSHKGLLEQSQGKTALSVADGEGRNSVYLAQHGLHVTAMDASPVGMEKARKLAAANDVSIDFQLADLRQWDWGAQQYDMVVAIFIQFADPAFRAEIFDGMKRALKPGGTILLHGYTPKQIDYKTGGPGVLENLYTEDMLRDTFGDMQISQLTAYDKEIHEGPGHSGISALIDLIATKPA
jgi:2-polyprenyl-3-methyl-5-hydroxy-6-metoxy-1,4-benzoquinol methylase